MNFAAPLYFSKRKDSIMAEQRPIMKFDLQSPWVIFARKISAMFGLDPEIKIRFGQIEEDKYELKLLVDNTHKACAIDKLLEKANVLVQDFGGVILETNVIYSNENSDISLFQTAFAGNKIFDRIERCQAPGTELDFVLFESKVIQIFTDDMFDFYGIDSCLAEDLARDIFNGEGNTVDDRIHFGTTESPDGIIRLH